VFVSLFFLASKLSLGVRPVVPKTDELVLHEVLSVAGTFAKAHKIPLIGAGF
jgi:hypothetical protein